MPKYRARIVPAKDNVTRDKVDGKWQVLIHPVSRELDTAPQGGECSYEDALQITNDFNEDRQKQTLPPLIVTSIR